MNGILAIVAGAALVGLMMLFIMFWYAPAAVIDDTKSETLEAQETTPDSLADQHRQENEREIESSRLTTPR